MDKVKFSRILFWIVILLTAIMTFWYIFGNSPDFEQILLLSLLGFYLKFNNLVITNRNDIKHFKKDLNEFKDNVTTSFNKTKEDIDILKKEIKK